MKHLLLPPLIYVALASIHDMAAQAVTVKNAKEIGIALRISIEDHSGNEISQATVTSAEPGNITEGLTFNFQRGGANSIHVYHGTQPVGKLIVTKKDAPPGSEIMLEGETSKIQVSIKRPDRKRKMSTSDTTNAPAAKVPKTMPTPPAAPKQETPSIVPQETPAVPLPETPPVAPSPELTPIVSKTAPTQAQPPVQSNTPKTLLEQIKEGKVLRKTTAQKQEPQKPGATLPSDIQKKLEERRQAIEPDEPEDKADWE